MPRRPRPLPQLMTAKMISEEMGLPASTVRRMMQRCDLVRFDGMRGVYVERDQILDRLHTIPTVPRSRA